MSYLITAASKCFLFLDCKSFHFLPKLWPVKDEFLKFAADISAKIVCVNTVECDSWNCRKTILSGLRRKITNSTTI